MYRIIIAGVVGLVFSLVVGPLWISFLRRKGIGQPIRVDGPQRHLKKTGTPTMGGVLILAGLTLAFFTGVIFEEKITTASFIVLLTALLCGLIGFVDDYLKTLRSRSLGIKARWKLLFLFLIALFLAWGAIKYGYGSPTTVGIPQFGLTVNLGLFYYLFVFIVLTATTTSVNFTDGLDGLAAGTVALIVSVYGAITFLQFRHLHFSYGMDLSILSAAVVGACAGFLWFNSYPADIFMGDTGALGLGGVIAALAVFTKTEFLLILLGGLLVVETLSVIIQVISFRWFGRRVFKMAPLHHHFELAGWSEFKIVVRFWVISFILSASGFIIFFTEIIRKL